MKKESWINSKRKVSPYYNILYIYFLALLAFTFRTLIYSVLEKNGFLFLFLCENIKRSQICEGTQTNYRANYQKFIKNWHLLNFVVFLYLNCFYLSFLKQCFKHTLLLTPLILVVSALFRHLLYSFFYQLLS